MSWFKKLNENIDEDTIIVRGEDGTVMIKNRLYRKFELGQDIFRQDRIYHYWFDLEDCNKINTHRSWYYEVKKHPCVYNCRDSGQTTEQWIKHVRSLPDTHFMKIRIIQILTYLGYATNSPKCDANCAPTCKHWRLN